ncbi:hypothetical protein DNH61_07785 [Paenibacillus sambharensis]|uniref:Cyanophage baseplate Pam3 plug gp18 domain-containing protein n=1 Tax=Paenibacillus sambharensis TaxID=1803190 RepID=A0A2W1LN94_9BACL|nr:hypothetical protein [Paenibacillus sambharensis]PZD96402.1 hypothetical protein DNH61_07785 [Paenibacillus sambharensis]
MAYIDIEKELIPYRFDMTIADKEYTFEIHYNAEHDFFTLSLEREGKLLVSGEKLVYGRALFADVWDSHFPEIAIIPYDESGQAAEVNWSTLSSSVFLYLMEEETDAD